LKKVREEMNDTVTVTFTSEQYKWVMAIANDTFNDATNWLYQTEDDGSEVYARQLNHNKRIMGLALAVLETKPKS
jgi:hypothetical protein